MITQMKIRKAKNEDIKAIAAIFRKEFGRKPYYEKWTEKTSLNKIKEYFKDYYTFVLEIEGMVVGFVIGSTFLWYDGRRGMVDEIVVSSEHQNKGLGGRLINHIEEVFRKKGIKKTTLLSCKRSKAFQIYKKKGYKEEDLVAMIKKI